MLNSLSIPLLTPSFGSAPYVAPAVHFDGTVSFGTASLVAPAPSGLFLGSIWINTTNPVSGQLFFQCDGRQPGGAYTSAFILQNSADPPTDFDVYLSDADSNNWIGTNGYTYTENVWTHFLVYGDTNHADPDKVFLVYRDDVDVTYSPQNMGPAFVMTWNGKPLDIGSAGDETNFLVADVADFRIFIPSTPLAVGGALPVDIRRLFISAGGKPVDPAIATAALGGAGPILCSGDDTAFFTNQGTGGALTPSPGSTGTLTNASSSPSD